MEWHLVHVYKSDWEVRLKASQHYFSNDPHLLYKINHQAVSVYTHLHASGHTKYLYDLRWFYYDPQSAYMLCVERLGLIGFCEWLGDWGSTNAFHFCFISARKCIWNMANPVQPMRLLCGPPFELKRSAVHRRVKCTYVMCFYLDCLAVCVF